MTFLELCQRLRQESGSSGDGPTAVTGQRGESQRIVSWVQAAWRDLQLKRERWRFNWAETVLDVEKGFRDFQAPSDMRSWDADTLVLDDTSIVVIPWHVFRREYRSAGHAGPNIATLTPQNVIRLNNPTLQDGELAFEYYRTPQELVKGTDTPRMPHAYHMAIVWYALMMYGYYENAVEVVQEAERKFNEVFDQMLLTELPAVKMAEPLV